MIVKSSGVVGSDHELITLPKVIGGETETKQLTKVLLLGYRRKDASFASFPNTGLPIPVQHTMTKIASIVYHRVKPRWLMVKIVDENGQHGWGEATLEGHDLAVEGCLDEMIPRIIGQEAK
jgi:hypothetical protein